MSLDPKVEENIREIIRDFNPDIFIVDIALHRSKHSKLVVLVDTDEGISLDDCVEISRRISRYVDEEDLMDFRFTLEVSSPGADQPLILKRQYKKNEGRTLKIRREDGSELKGKLIRAEEDKILIEPEQKKKKGSGKKEAEERLQEAVEIPYDQIKEAKVVISFK